MLAHPQFGDPLVTEMAEPEFAAVKKSEICKFSSTFHRNLAINELARERAGLIPPAVEPVENVTVMWSNMGCQTGAAYGGTSCPHATVWWGTTNDAYLGQICQVGDACCTPCKRAVDCQLIQCNPPELATRCSHGLCRARLLMLTRLRFKQPCASSPPTKQRG
jgi:hypothetical protein